MKLYRQGDLLIQSLDKAPKGKRRLRQNGVLAEGEVTGHMHQVEDTTKAEVYEIGKQLLLSTATGIRIVHDEHNPLTLPAGDYKVIRQREFKGVGMRPQRVAD